MKISVPQGKQGFNIQHAIMLVRQIKNNEAMRRSIQQQRIQQKKLQESIKQASSETVVRTPLPTPNKDIIIQVPEKHHNIKETISPIVEPAIEHTRKIWWDMVVQRSDKFINEDLHILALDPDNDLEVDEGEEQPVPAPEPVPVLTPWQKYIAGRQNRV